MGDLLTSTPFDHSLCPRPTRNICQTLNFEKHALGISYPYVACTHNKVGVLQKHF